MRFSRLPQAVGLLNLMLSLFVQLLFMGENAADVILWINIGLCQKACELICFKLGTMPNTTKLYSLIPV